jgi:hypothetical protein
MTSASATTSGFSRTDVTDMTDVAEFIDQRPMGAFQIQVLLLCAAVLFFDGFDTQAIGYVAPDLARDWNLRLGALGPVFSAGLFGLMISAFVLSPIADRIGRKQIIVFSTFAFGAGSLLTILAQDVRWLILLRFLTGLGLGAAMPNAVALIAEFSPRRRGRDLLHWVLHRRRTNRRECADSKLLSDDDEIDRCRLGARYWTDRVNCWSPPRRHHIVPSHRARNIVYGCRHTHLNCMRCSIHAGTAAFATRGQIRNRIQ